LSAGAQTPPPPPEGPAIPVLPEVRSEVVDPTDKEAIAWLCDLFRTGRADLYGQDEADLALLPTLTRTWMKRGEQLKIRAPGTNQKRSVSSCADLSDGGLVWRTDERRCADQFCATLVAGAKRSRARGRLAVFLVDNAQSHRVGKTGIVRRGLNALAGQVVLVFLPAYSPDLQPAERVWRQWRPNVTHNHQRSDLDELQADSDGWFERMASQPETVRRMLGTPGRRPIKMAA
jgi:transposase